MAVIQELLDARKRFEHWTKVQAAINSDDPDMQHVEAKMMNARADFLSHDGRVFFERIIGQSDLMPIAYLALGQQVARSVGRIRVASPSDGEGFATGFLVAPGLLMTNHHVLPTPAWAAAANVSFDAEDDLDGHPKVPRTFVLDPNAAYVSDEHLDFCIVGVASRAVDGTPLSDFGYLKLIGAPGKILRGEYASIIQHPNGRQKQIAIRENKVLVYVYDEQVAAGTDASDFLYYSTDTSPGSSGSPVFSDQWAVVAMHRRGVPKTRLVNGVRRVIRKNGRVAFDDDPDSVIAYEANEGVRVSKILAKLAALGERSAPGAESARVILRRIEAAAEASAPSAAPLSRFAHVAVPLARPRQPEVEISWAAEDRFHDGAGSGYDENFLPIPVPMPKPNAELKRELARRVDAPDEFFLPFKHFTTCVHAERRLPVFAAVNVADIGRPKAMPGRPKWYLDPRIAEDQQPDDSIFSDELHRGHMAAREYVYWGRSEGERQRADADSFTLTNACPQLRSFNSSGGEWWNVERAVMTALKGQHGRCSVFMGPIFRTRDQAYDRLRSKRSTANRGTGIRIPTRFWKVVVWVEDDQLFYRAFLFDKSDELREAGDLEFVFDTPEGVTETTLEAISRSTGLQFAF